MTFICSYYRLNNHIFSVLDSNPSSPSTTVISAHVHPAPSASHVPIPGTGADSQATASAPPEIPAHTSPALEIPVEPQDTESPEPPIPAAEPEPVPKTVLSPLPSTPPPSPETPHMAASTPPPPQREVNAHPEPEENSESDIQSFAVGAANTEDSVSYVVTTPPSQPVEHCETDNLSAVTTDVTPPQSPSLTQTNADLTNASSFLTLTPEKPPVQDTTPPADKIPIGGMDPEEVSEPLTAQVNIQYNKKKLFQHH